MLLCHPWSLISPVHNLQPCHTPAFTRTVLLSHTEIFKLWKLKISGQRIFWTHSSPLDVTGVKKSPKFWLFPSLVWKVFADLTALCPEKHAMVHLALLMKSCNRVDDFGFLLHRLLHKKKRSEKLEMGRKMKMEIKGRGGWQEEPVLLIISPLECERGLCRGESDFGRFGNCDKILSNYQT